MDREKIFEVLSEWNFWHNPLPSSIVRKEYEKEIMEKSNTGEIIILKGARRSGKSTLLINHIKNLIKNKVPVNSILFVNLEDPRFTPYLNLDLLEQIKECYLFYLNPEQKPIILLDEIQNIPEFEKWIYKEYELKKSKLIITGSNSKLLSREIGTSLSGRYLDIEVMPLSFKEFLKFKNKSIKTKGELIAKQLEINRLFEEYLFYGGYPGITLLQNNNLKKEELKMYFDSILLRDIVARYKLENFYSLQKLAVILLSSIGNPVSLNSLKHNLNVSFDLIKKYVEYLENAYMIFRIPFFNWSLKKQLANPQKIFSIDNGITTAVSFFTGKRKGYLLENIVFLQLKKSFNEIYYYKTSQNYEIDFLIKEKETIRALIQVCYNFENKKTFEREVRALLKAANELKFAEQSELLILTLENSQKLFIENKEIKIKNVIEWLLFEN